MAKREIIRIDEDKCDGCGLCIPNCPEGALQVIDGKARLVSDLMCDGLGACIGHCPQGAIEIEEREAEEYDEKKVMENIAAAGENTIKAHLEHLKEHGQKDYLKQAIEYLQEHNIEVPLQAAKSHSLPCGCPGSAMREVKHEKTKDNNSQQDSTLSQWPVQLNLLPPSAPFFNNSNLLISADCVPFANANFHSNLLKGRSIGIGCPKLDDLQAYEDKIKSIIESNNLNSITVAIMEVPCCYGLYKIVEDSIEDSGKDIQLTKVVVGVDGGIKN